VFHIYVLFLILSGIAMLVMAGVKTGRAPRRRAWNAVFGAVFAGYGLYLLLFFRGGHYLIFFYAFIVPILMIVQFVRDRSVYRARQQAAAFQGPTPGYGQPSGYDQSSGYGESAGGQPQGPVQ
jgi:predicted lipid-binding transport protein (Tim44 family)